MMKSSQAAWSTIIAIVFSIAALVFSGVSIARFLAPEKGVLAGVTENPVWVAAQAQLELARFQVALHDLANSRTAENADKLIERFEILWSRLNVYRAGRFAAQIASEVDLREGVANARLLLAEIEPALKAVAAGDSDNFDEIWRKVRPLQGVVQKLALDGLAAERREQQFAIERHQELTNDGLILGAGSVIALMITMGVLLAGSQRARRLANDAIAARVEAEQARHELDTAIESVSEGFVIFGSDQRLVRANKRYREFFGTISDAAQPGARLDELLRLGIERGQYAGVEEPGPWIEARIERWRSGRALFETQLGDGRWLRISERQTSNGGTVGIYTDITESKLREQALETARQALERQTHVVELLAEEARQTSVLLRTAIDTMSEAFAVYDAEDRLVLFNDRFRQIFGKVAEKVHVGLEFATLLREGLQAKIFAVSDEAASDIEIDAVIAERVRKRRAQPSESFEFATMDGHWFQVKNYLGAEGGVVTVYIDLTERRRRELMIQRSEDQLRATVNSALDSIIVMDSRGKVVSFNPAAERCFGFTREEAVGRRLSDLILPHRHRDAHEKGLERYLRTGHGPVLRKRLELTALRKDGSEFDVELAIEATTGDDGDIFIGYMRDITERKLTAAQLHKAKEQAEAANTAKSAFLAMMSHEIRTPMTGVVGSMRLLSEMNLPGDARRLIETASSSGEALVTILNDILDLTKIEAGKIDLEQDPFSPAAVVKNVVDLFSPMISAKRLDVILEVGADVPDWVQGDSGRVRQMLSNYISNAVKFTEKGWISISVKRSGGVDSSLLRFSVADSGPGIDPSRSNEVFQDFTQLDQRLARRHGGTGLGLSITRKLAHLMGGSANFASVLGQGSRFWFDLSLPSTDRPEAVDVAETPVSLQIGSRPVSVLIAEDSSSNQMLMRVLLEQLGCRVEVAGSGIEVLQAVRRRAFDIILMDLSMPEMDGVEATTRLRASGTTVPIVACTATVPQKGRVTVAELGFAGWLTKPFSRTRLRRVLQEALPEIRAFEPEEAEAEAEAEADAASHEPMVQRAPIANLVNAVGADVASRLIQRALNDIESYSGQCRAALTTGDGPAARRAAHALVGVCQTYGAEQLATLAFRIECELDLESDDTRRAGLSQLDGLATATARDLAATSLFATEIVDEPNSNALKR